MDSKCCGRWSLSSLFGPIRQIGYVTRDAMESMRRWVGRIGVGPWYYFDSIMDVRYAGGSCSVDVRIAFANSGNLQLELIEQRSDLETAFKPLLARPSELERPHHYGF